MHHTLHEILDNFILWIAPDPQKIVHIVQERESVRRHISALANADGLYVLDTPDAGSFAKQTGLRQHTEIDSETGALIDIEGLDVDCPFVLGPLQSERESLFVLLPLFEKYAKEAYPLAQIKRQKNAIKLVLASKNLQFDLVPLLAANKPKTFQIILRDTGERKITAVQSHVHFIQSRLPKAHTHQSSKINTQTLNQYIRIFKWWKERIVAQEKKRTGLARPLDLPSFLIELLCVKMYDTIGILDTHEATLFAWLEGIIFTIAGRIPVAFDDFVDTYSFAKPCVELHQESIWTVLDPINGTNNVISPETTAEKLDILQHYLEKIVWHLRQAQWYFLQETTPHTSEAARFHLRMVLGRGLLN